MYPVTLAVIPALCHFVLFCLVIMSLTFVALAIIQTLTLSSPQYVSPVYLIRQFYLDRCCPKNCQHVRRLLVRSERLR